MKRGTPDSAKLYGIAEGQQGLFTAKQAKACGYADNTHPYHVRAGHWIREHRGIYRLERFPASDEEQLVLWSLWSANRREVPQGVYSHATALAIHELSDAMPAKLHMTVPPAYGQARHGQPRNPCHQQRHAQRLRGRALLPD
jgi:predicted transcriptional regulator of viral defense system